jgi:MtN3 and saliva related transmembrane protein
MNFVEWIGYIATACSAISYLPQVKHLWKTRSAQGVSLGSYLLLIMGNSLWLWYGVCLGKWPIIIANCMVLTSLVSALGLKLFIDYTEKKKRPQL